MLSCLSEWGKVVVTFTNENKVFSKNSFGILNENGLPEFELETENEVIVNMTITSIGISHAENVNTRYELTRRFENVASK